MKKAAFIFTTIFLLTSEANAMADWSFLFSNIKYQRNIKMNAYVLSEDRISDFLSKEGDKKIEPQAYRELFGKTIYLAVSLKNFGRQGAWGELSCVVGKPGSWVYTTRRIYINGVPVNMWNKYLIPLGKFTASHSNDVPVVSIKWEKLYAK